MGCWLRPRTNEEGIVFYDLNLYYKDSKGESVTDFMSFKTSEEAFQYILNNDPMLRKKKER
ncbi:hypothetical protein JOC70_003803 [Clostridium pascui]|uniref:hypothetical protein n=1 Tax=Clostridium pascui TaxID=46609 RepID=UPI001957F138|nr:hypothetical protein [Clostridium pascui]MBM7872248.1 hypothetical protein [Clostridium pascui]